MLIGWILSSCSWPFGFLAAGWLAAALLAVTGRLLPLLTGGAFNRLRLFRGTSPTAAAATSNGYRLSPRSLEGFTAPVNVHVNG